MTPQRERLVRVALRTVAILIAIGGVVDPVLSVERAMPDETGIVVSVLPLHRAAAAAAIRPLDVAGKREVESCGAEQPCVIVSDGAAPVEVPADRTAPIMAIHVAESTAPNVRLMSAAADPFQHLYSSGVVHVALEGRGVSGKRTEIEVRDGKAVVGVAVVDWKQDGRQEVDVAWWPVTSAGRQLTVEASASGGEAELFDNAIDLGVDVRVGRFRVLVFEPRPSWSATFVRRALEKDGRFSVDHRSRLAPMLTAGTAEAGLDRSSLERADLVVIGAPEALTNADVELLDRYVQVRGGSLFLVPDRAPTGPSLRLFGTGWKEELNTDARLAGALRASEMLVNRERGPLDTIVAGIEERAVMISKATGRGHILLSGMMDAWRFRAQDADGFDRFWQRVGADAAARGTKLSVEVGQPLATVGAKVPFKVRVRSMEPAGSETVTANIRCVNGPLETVRLWPTGEPDVFEGVAVASQPWGCRIEARAGSESTIASFPSVTNPRFGVANNLAALDQVLRVQRVQPVHQVHQVHSTHLMHSPLWMFPFVTLLGAEWWLRRRSGLR